MSAITELRADWAQAQGASSVRMHAIGETGRYINGVAFKPADWGEKGIPIVRIQNLTDPNKPMNRTTRIVDSSYLIRPGDLLVSWSATLDAFIWDREPALLNQHIFKVIPNTELVSKKYLFFALRRSQPLQPLMIGAGQDVVEDLGDAHRSAMALHAAAASGALICVKTRHDETALRRSAARVRSRRGTRWTGFGRRYRPP